MWELHIYDKDISNVYLGMVGSGVGRGPLQQSWEKEGAREVL